MVRFGSLFLVKNMPPLQTPQPEREGEAGETKAVAQGRTDQFKENLERSGQANPPRRTKRTACKSRSPSKRLSRKETIGISKSCRRPRSHLRGGHDNHPGQTLSFRQPRPDKASAGCPSWSYLPWFLPQQAGVALWGRHIDPDKSQTTAPAPGPSAGFTSKQGHDRQQPFRATNAARAVSPASRQRHSRPA
jgi:hypothetical protein